MGSIAKDTGGYKIPFALKPGEVAQIHDNYIVVGTMDQAVERYWIDDQKDEDMKTILGRPVTCFDTAQEAFDSIPDPAEDKPFDIIPGPGLVGLQVGAEARLVQKPSVGRILHYWNRQDQEAPHAAIIVHVWDDVTVNVCAFHPFEGAYLAPATVEIWDGTGIKPTHDFAEWPPRA